MLKELFQSWFKRHENKHEEVPMSDSATDLAAVAPEAPSVHVVQDVTVPDPVVVADALRAHFPQQSAKADPDYVEPEGTNAIASDAKVQHDAFAEKLRHVLKLAEVEIEHVWEEAVALAKKLV